MASRPAVAMPDLVPVYDFIGPAVTSVEEFIYGDVNYGDVLVHWLAWA
jgi:hypothetical protein